MTSTLDSSDQRARRSISHVGVSGAPEWSFTQPLAPATPPSRSVSHTPPLPPTACVPQSSGLWLNPLEEFSQEESNLGAVDRCLAAACSLLQFQIAEVGRLCCWYHGWECESPSASCRFLARPSDSGMEQVYPSLYHGAALILFLSEAVFVPYLPLRVDKTNSKAGTATTTGYFVCSFMIWRYDTLKLKCVLCGLSSHSPMFRCPLLCATPNVRCRCGPTPATSAQRRARPWSPCVSTCTYGRRRSKALRQMCRGLGHTTTSLLAIRYRLR